MMRLRLPRNCPHFAQINPHSTQAHPTRQPREFNDHTVDLGGRTNHDFFSGSGSSYVIGKAENTEDDDWDF